jgi:hypothetical protein
MRDALVLFGAGYMGRMAVEYFGSRNISFIIDNNQGGRYLCGVPVISYSDFLRSGYNGNIVVSTNEGNFNGIKQQLNNDSFFGVDHIKFESELLFKPRSNLQELKDIHKGKRCFIVGNGASLTFDDIETLRINKELSFGFNGIYKAFNQTKWRPTYFMTADPAFIKHQLKEALSFDCIYIVDAVAASAIFESGEMKEPTKKVLEYMVDRLAVNSEGTKLCGEYIVSRGVYPKFSNAPDRFVYTGGTIAFDALQFAAYMGFNRVYMLGVDLYKSNLSSIFSFPDVLVADGAGDSEHFISNYYDKGETFYTNDVELMQMAFVCAENYSRTHGFRIFNATRGGHLEAFERVDFDSLFG